MKPYQVWFDANDGSWETHRAQSGLTNDNRELLEQFALNMYREIRFLWVPMLKDSGR
jgi:hypothetical protein